ncbi:IS66-like element accessory protein TnpA [Acidocella sp.]|uniref:IS66-like element accessory protein TnpA n=1 Tax=Acidocella sp. TaxID=50710 RepID=UPI0018565207|nr:transposase [Acidocella sp.]NNM56429.1 transposase [Acidocella sp.]
MDKDGPDPMRKHSLKNAEYHRVEVITGQKRRRDWTAEEKAEILAATMAPGATVTEVAQRFEVSRGLLWTWRRKAMDELAEGMAPRFVPLRIESEVAESTAVVAEPASLPSCPPSGREQPAGSIEIEVGRARVRVEGAVDPEVLRQLLGLIGPQR